jgi:hypothetical protein
MPFKRVRVDTTVLQALQLLAADDRRTFQDLVDEALADLLKKHHRPVGLANALRQSLRRLPANTDGLRRRH